jgi:hypothetical protein
MVATEPAYGAHLIVEAVRAPAGQDACRRMQAATVHLGEGTLEECVERIDQATARRDFAAVLPDGELRHHLTVFAEAELVAASRCLDLGVPDELYELDDTPLYDFYDRLYQLGVDLYDNYGEI